MSGFRYFPGQSSGPKQYQGYSERQEANWEILNRAYYSASFGYGRTQMPFPGSKIDTGRYDAWREKFLSSWKQESSRTPGTRGMDTQDFTEAHLRHIYLSMMEVEAAYPKALEEYQSLEALAYSRQVGTYTRVGNRVTVSFLPTLPPELTGVDPTPINTELILNPYREAIQALDEELDSLREELEIPLPDVQQVIEEIINREGWTPGEVIVGTYEEPEPSTLTLQRLHEVINRYLNR